VRYIGVDNWTGFNTRGQLVVLRACMRLHLHDYLGLELVCVGMMQLPMKTDEGRKVASCAYIQWNSDQLES
jgi:hypothetical protein